MMMLDPHPNTLRLMAGLRIAYLGLIVYLLLNLGGVDPFTQNGAAIVMAIIMGMAFLVAPVTPSMRALWFTGAITLMVMAGAIWLQIWRLDQHPFEHPAWALARAELDHFVGATALKGTISVAPGQTSAAFVSLAPILGFMAVLQLAASTQSAFMMLQRLAYIGAFFAVFGLYHLLFMPRLEAIDLLSAPSGSLTGLLINRNSAGAFLGTGFVLSTGLTLFYLRSITLENFTLARLSRKDVRNTPYRQVVIFTGLSGVQLLALLLTQSRGALVSTLVALVLLITLHLRAGPLSMDKSSYFSGLTLFPGFTLSQPLVKAGVLSASIVLVLWLFGERTAYRFDAHGVDAARVCVYQSTLAGILETWRFGAGFGAFLDVFPAYRDAQCAGISGIWESAHNSYLEGMLGLGWIFLPLVAVIWFSLLRTFRNGMRERRQYRFAPNVGLAVLVQISLHALVDFSLHIPGIAFYTAGILASCASIAQARRHP